MLKWFSSKKKKDNKGFTLVELVIVIAILAILVGLLAPQYTKYVEKARKSADVDNLEEIVRAFQVAVADIDIDVEAKTYKITIDKDKMASISPETDAIEEALEDTLGVAWKETPLKSGNWSGDQISAEITVESSGAVSVEYCDDVEAYERGSSNSGSSAVTPTP